METPKSSFSPLQSFLRSFQKIKEKAKDMRLGLKEKMTGVEHNIEKQWEHREETLGRVRRRAVVVQKKLVEKAELAGEKLGSMLAGTTPMPQEKSSIKRLSRTTSKRKTEPEKALSTKSSPLTRKLSRSKAKV